MKKDYTKELLEALKDAVKCVEYCRRAHKDAQSGSGFPIEAHWKTLIACVERGQ